MQQATGPAERWWAGTHSGNDVLVAYFSMEFGVDVNLPIYSGGLGILAGDHLKAAAELGLPLVGVGLLYRGGYFTQGLSAEGRQTETYTAIDPEALGLQREPVTVEVDLAGETVTADVWRVRRRRRLVDGRAALPARRRPAHRRALFRRPRAPDPPGAAPRRRRRPRARRARSRADRLPRQRGALGIPRDRAGADARRRRPVEPRRARAHPALDGLHDPYAGSRGQRGVRRRARAPLRKRPGSAGRHLGRGPARARAAATAPTASA